ncbi:Mob1/phocein [Fomitiporia mediterranea MF3/22]|uniref:Mob1/phocein n=1 Tax=Fomitiporia mediterranea (strain MF3/22) TaxID=694068 RepID=UPI00044096F5|nr:Mob1/phocein [Fomitiporia mediterranea MF3/22]EJD05475.1 Mob1/phocein [Fomitiporia mediterranea MF3/22]
MVVATRPLRGSRLASFFPSVPAEGPSLSDLDSAFQLQEYIALLIRKNPHDVDTIVSLPERVKMSGKEDDKSDMSQDKGDVVVDEACWIYEQLRRLAQDLTHPLITLLQQECSRASCPEMKAGEWLYLCVAHGNDGAMEQCCAIDYIIHTLDSATALLNSPRAFPSRISIPQPSVRHFSSLARRLGRIFAHAYFHHREAFESAEAENSLYARFLALTSRFELVPPEFLVIPPRMTNTDASSTSPAEAEPPRLLGAALNPQPPSPERSGLAGYESPRKVGRNRTDTMVFSEAEAYSEALRGNTGSPPDPGSSDTSEHRVHQGLNLDTAESETT